jgi:hypothetical protein
VVVQQQAQQQPVSAMMVAMPQSIPEVVVVQLDGIVWIVLPMLKDRVAVVEVAL